MLRFTENHRNTNASKRSFFFAEDAAVWVNSTSEYDFFLLSLVALFRHSHPFSSLCIKYFSLILSLCFHLRLIFLHLPVSLYPLDPQIAFHFRLKMQFEFLSVCGQR